MKLIKIGSSQACQLVINDDHVSKLHAEITVLDDGQIFIEDKNSLNGTFVDGNRIEPGKSVSIQRGDRVTFGNQSLVWARVPMPENLSGYKAVYNIGSNFRNDIILNNQTVSSYHASLRIAKDGKAYIHDNGSTNGTKVNGVNIAKGKDVRIKKGDNVICSTEDITNQIETLIPSSNWKLFAGIGAGTLAVMAAVILAIILWPSPEPNARQAVVYVRTIFHPVVTFEDNPMPDFWNGEISFDEMTMTSQATAFFLDKEGRMGTNRHVVAPWEELDKKQLDALRQEIEDNMPKSNNEDDVNTFLQNSIFGKAVLQYSLANCRNDRARFVKYVLDVTARIRKSSYTISGKIDHITVGYAGKYYTHTDEFQRCNVLRVSDNKDVDLAILQLNNKKTPEDVSFVFDMEKVFVDKLVPLRDQLYTIGYPAGFIWGLDEASKSLEPSIRATKCSKEPSRYYFEFQANSVSGSSGSPVYNKKGELVGVLFGGYSIAGGATKAIHAKFLKKMYEEELSGM